MNDWLSIYSYIYMHVYLKHVHYVNKYSMGSKELGHLQLELSKLH